jgi:glycine/D-amino acid oxidase-like deaminating enzyme
MSQPLKLDVAIFGGGIAGLWTLSRLLKQGFNAHLFECHQVGGGQSIASQGIIHGGTKYALTGKITGASEAIREMPAIWNQCLAGEGEIDLSEVKVNSTHQLLWTQASLKSKVGGFFASKVMSSRMTKLSSDDVPEIFRDAKFKGTVYRLDEQVLDPRSLFQCLFNHLSGYISFYSADQLAFNSERNDQFKIDALSFDAKAIVFAAGEGNEQLLQKADLKQPLMQRRPLHMPMVRSPSLPQLTAHALGHGTVPRMTITANTDKSGYVVWYLGGKIAEEGVGSTADELIQRAKEELNDLLPWMDWGSMKWSTLMINRAEPLIADGSRPDRPYVQRNNKIITAWPVKLAFAPLVAKEIEDQVRDAGVGPSHSKVVTGLPTPPLSYLPWDEVTSWT